MNSLNLSFGQELKRSYLNESFLLLNNMFRKNEKKKIIITAKKFLIVFALPETEDHINSFQINLPPPYHLKTSGFLYLYVVRKSDLKWVNR